MSGVGESRGKKRARTGKEGGSIGKGGADADVKLSPELQKLVGRKYAKESELSREVLLEYAKQKGGVKVVTLSRVSVEEFGGRSFEVVLDSTANKVRDLKRSIEEEQGTKYFHQNLFLLVGGQATSEEPTGDEAVLSDESRLALCVSAEEDWEWDASSPLLSGDTKQFKLSGEGNRIATKIDKDDDEDHNLVTSRVMDSGKHRISFKVMKGEGTDLSIAVGVTRDGAGWNKWHGDSTNGWFIDTLNGGLYGNGILYDNDPAGEIKDGQIVTVELNADAGTLKFWVDGKPHSSGWGSGVKGRLRWAANSQYVGSAFQIVPTPQLEAWKEWDGTRNDAE